MRLRILGVDPGSRVTGFGCIDADGSRLRLVDAGVIRCQGAELAPRLVQIHNALRRLIEDLCPDVAAVEGVFVQRNARTALILGQARGAALCALAGEPRPLPVHEYPAARVKQALVGTGRAEKRQVQHMVRALLGIAETMPADAADALALAVCHAHYHAARRSAKGTTG